MTMEVPKSAQVLPPDEREMAEWNEAVEGAAEVLGHSLYGGKENDKKLDSLIGVPFVITGMTFREGDIIPALGRLNYDGKRDKETPRDYVSVEILVHPAHAHKFNRKYVVFNDGSTGIYRQVVKFLTGRGDLEPLLNLPEDGDANTTRYDVSLSQDSHTDMFFNGNLRCPEGLRKSEYKGPAGDSVTWYLA